MSGMSSPVYAGDAESGISDAQSRAVGAADDRNSKPALHCELKCIAVLDIDHSLRVAVDIHGYCRRRENAVDIKRHAAYLAQVIIDRAHWGGIC